MSKIKNITGPDVARTDYYKEIKRYYDGYVKAKGRPPPCIRVSRHTRWHVVKSFPQASWDFKFLYENVEVVA